MSNAVSALNGVSDGNGFVEVSELGLQGMITLRGDLSAPVLAEVLGCAVPDQRQITHAEGVSVAWMSPDEVLILCAHGDAPGLVDRLNAALAGSHALVVNVSDARAMFRLSGDAVRDVVAKLAPVDMARDRFKPGEIRRTRFAQVAAAFYLRDDTTCEIVCFRSVAQYMFDLLKSVSRTGGELDFF